MVLKDTLSAVHFSCKFLLVMQHCMILPLLLPTGSKSNNNTARSQHCTLVVACSRQHSTFAAFCLFVACIQHKHFLVKHLLRVFRFLVDDLLRLFLSPSQDSAACLLRDRRVASLSLVCGENVKYLSRQLLLLSIASLKAIQSAVAAVLFGFVVNFCCCSSLCAKA